MWHNGICYALHIALGEPIKIHQRRGAGHGWLSLPLKTSLWWMIVVVSGIGSRNKTQTWNRAESSFHLHIVLTLWVARGVTIPDDAYKHQWIFISAVRLINGCLTLMNDERWPKREQMKVSNLCCQYYAWFPPFRCRFAVPVTWIP